MKIPYRLFNTFLILSLALSVTSAFAAPVAINITKGTEHITIQDAVDNSSPADIIELAPATIYERLITLANRDITIRGAGPSQTIIDGQNVVGSILKPYGGDESVFENIIFRNGLADKANGGGAVFQQSADTTTTFINCIFDSNDSNSYTIGAIYIERGGSSFYNCVFRNNKTLHNGNATALGVLNGKVDFINCLFENEIGGLSVLYYQDANGPSTGTITNCTFADWQPGRFIRARGTGTNIDIVNSVFDASAFPILTWFDGTYSINRSVFPNATGDNIAGTPSFIDAPAGDYRLAPGSFGIDVADLDAYRIASGSTTGLLGEPRLIDNCMAPNNGLGIFKYLDAGAYESQFNQVPVHQQNFDGTNLNYSVNGTAVLDNGSLRLTENYGSQTGSVIFEPISDFPIESCDVSFDFRIGPSGSIPADGISFALMDADLYDNTELFGEDGPGTGSLSISLDTFYNEFIEPGTKFVEILLDGTSIATAFPAFDISTTQWHHADISLDDGNLTVSISPAGGIPETIFDAVPIPGFVPSASRFGFGARTGGFSSEHRIDNVSIIDTSDSDGDQVGNACDLFPGYNDLANLYYDNVIDLNDFSILSNDFGNTSDCIADINNDNSTDITDLQIFAINWLAAETAR